MVSSTQRPLALKTLHRDIAKGSLIVALFIFFAALARGALEVFIAWRYGVSETVDAYYFVLSFVSWPISIWFSTVTVVLVPMFAQMRHGPASEVIQFRAELLGATITLSAIVAAIVFMTLEYLFWTPFTGLSEIARGAASGVAAVLSLLVPLGFLAGLLSAWFIAGNRHINTLLEGVPAIVVITCLLLIPDPSLASLVWGTVAGFAARLVLLHGLLGAGERARKLAFKLRSPWWRVVRKNSGLMLVGQALMASTLVIDQFFAAHLGTGAVALFNYASRMLAIVLLFGATSVQRATLPIFSSAHVNNDKRLRSVISSWVRLMVLVGFVAVLIGWLIAPTGIAALFQRGAFTEADAAAVTELFRTGLLQIPMYFGGLVLVSALAARGLHQAIAMSGLVGLATKFAANVALVPLFGLRGLMLGTAAMYAATIAYLALSVRRAER